MVSAAVNTARNVTGIIGNITSLFLFLSPVPTFVGIVKKSSVEQYSAAPYLATLINCMVWVLYGLPMVHPHSMLVATISGFGAAIELVYIILFLIYSDKKKRLKVLMGILVGIIFIAIFAFLVLTLLHATKQRSTVVGTVGVLFGIIMYASPLSIMKLVIATRSVEYMPFYLSLASFANGVIWATYACLPFDQFLAIPSGFGTLFSMTQLILYAWYYKSTKQQIAERKAKAAELDLSDVVLSGELRKISNPTQNGLACENHGGV